MTILFACIALLLFSTWVCRPRDKRLFKTRWAVMIAQLLLILPAAFLGFISFLSAIAGNFTAADHYWRAWTMTSFGVYFLTFLLTLVISYWLSKYRYIKWALAVQLAAFIPFLVGCYGFITLMKG